MTKMKASTLVEKAIDIAKNYKTLYVMGCFGAPLTGSNVSRYCTNHSYNKQAARTAMIKAVADQNPPVYGFDCVCLIKGILWGWCGNASKSYGGAQYTTNNVPDIGADQAIAVCEEVSTANWAAMTVGEAVWCSGHIGIYIGDGLAVECTPRWQNCVQITAVANIGPKVGYNARTWTKHGKMPWVDYADIAVTPVTTTTQTTGTDFKVGDEVTFTGVKHYVSSNSTNGKTCQPGKARITSIASAGKHPYHLVKTSGSASTVYGWVDAADIKTEEVALVKGTKVRVNNGAKTYTNGSLVSYVYSTTYEVIQVNGDRVVIGINGKVTAAINRKDLTVV